MPNSKTVTPILHGNAKEEVLADAAQHATAAFVRSFVRQRWG
jgi:hypothetical protein